MQCQQCGKDVAENSKFCAYCGERLAGGTGTMTPTEMVADRFVGGSSRGGPPPEEDELWDGSYSPKAMFGEFIAADVVTLLAIVGALLFWNSPGGWWATIAVILVLWATFGLVLAYRMLSVRYRLTRFRFFHDRGILSRVSDRIEAIDIDDVSVRQGLIERLMGVGTIIISSSDRSHPNLVLPGIDDVRQVADLIDATRRAERQRRGLHIESI